jgi:hypothetical protein
MIPPTGGEKVTGSDVESVKAADSAPKDLGSKRRKATESDVESVNSGKSALGKSREANLKKVGPYLPKEKGSVVVEQIQAFFGDSQSNMYFDFSRGVYYEIVTGAVDFETDEMKEEARNCEAYGFKAVAGPRSFELALKDEKWGEPSRLEKETLKEGAIVQVSEKVARDAIAQGADLVKLFPVYEEKVKDGKTIKGGKSSDGEDITFVDFSLLSPHALRALNRKDPPIKINIPTINHHYIIFFIFGVIGNYC